MLISHLAAYRLRHIEAAHPADPRIFHYPTEARWLESLRRGKLARWTKTDMPPRQSSGTRIICQGARPKCEHCGPGHAMACIPKTFELALLPSSETRTPPAGWSKLLPPKIVNHEAFLDASRYQSCKLR